MAYGAVVSLELTMKHLLNSSRISIVVNSSPQNIQLMHDEVRSLREVLEEMDRSRNKKKTRKTVKRVNALDGQIKEAVCEFEDVLESHLSDEILSQSEQNIGEEIHPLMLFSVDLQELKQDIDSFTRTVSKMKKSYIDELRNSLPEEDEEEEDEERTDEQSRIDQFGGNESKYKQLMVWLLGMAGIGKTTLAKKLFQDPLLLSLFSTHAFVSVGPKYQLEEILLDILKQINPGGDESRLIMGGEEKLASLKKMMEECLKDRRYLIVLDDIWNEEIWEDLIPSFPVDNNGSQVLLTTRLDEMVGGTYYNLRFLDKKESWDLLREKVFGQGYVCPPHLEKPGKKIAENCEGLPLTIVTVADILSKADKTAEYWEKVAEKRDSVYMNAYEQMYEVLYLSYEYLPQQLTACFLYMGGFPQSYEISCSNLINLWIAEGFVETVEELPDTEWYITSTYIAVPYLHQLALQCLHYLCFNNVVMVHKKNYSNGIKTCSLHSPFWYLCNKEAGKNKFFHGLNSRADALAEGLKNERRLCICNSVLFAIEDAYNAMASVSTVRSLLCTGPYHQYPVPICFDLMLMRLLHALTIRLYDFPMEVVRLVRLRYLALTFNGNLPASISKLLSLQFLIVHHHLSIMRSDGKSLYLPKEIWYMKELKHLQIMGNDLPDPCEGCVLPNLLTLLDVGA